MHEEITPSPASKTPKFSKAEREKSIDQSLLNEIQMHFFEAKFGDQAEEVLSGGWLDDTLPEVALQQLSERFSLQSLYGKTVSHADTVRGIIETGLASNKEEGEIMLDLQEAFDLIERLQVRH